MSLLSNLKSDDSIAGERDSVGGSVLDSALYPSKVVSAYMIKAASGAVGVVMAFKTSTGRDIRQTVYVTAGDAKGGNNFYTDKEGAKQYLPGFLLANSLALLTVGKKLSDLASETKVVSAYSKEAKADVPTKVEMLVELIGKDILVGLIKQTVDKTVKTDAGYVATGETREENEIDKFFRASDRKTVAEIRGQAETAAFVVTWEAKHTGNTRNKAKGASGAGGVAGAPKAAGVSTKPKASLFA